MVPVYRPLPLASCEIWSSGSGTITSGRSKLLFIRFRPTPRMLSKLPHTQLCLCSWRTDTTKLWSLRIFRFQWNGNINRSALHGMPAMNVAEPSLSHIEVGCQQALLPVHPAIAVGSLQAPNSQMWYLMQLVFASDGSLLRPDLIFLTCPTLMMLRKHPRNPKPRAKVRTVIGKSSLLGIAQSVPPNLKVLIDQSLGKSFITGKPDMLISLNTWSCVQKLWSLKFRVTCPKTNGPGRARWTPSSVPNCLPKGKRTISTFYNTWRVHQPSCIFLIFGGGQNPE